MFNVGMLMKSGLVISGIASIPFLVKSSITNKNFEKSEKVVIHSTGEKIGPIFDCGGSGENYRVYLVPEKDNWTKTDGTSNNIALQVIENEGQRKTEKIVWGPKSLAKNKWEEWEINVSEDGTSTILIKSSKDDAWFKTAFCLENNKVIPIKNENSIGVTFLRIKSGTKTEGVEFKLSGCQVNGENEQIEECEIEFDQGSLFRWNEFKPKVTISKSEKLNL